ncbi:MAG: iron chelate uptake ABC transporter family permease subunit, partial [Rhizobiales bacterium]|nr:iron chelate uptake ABC transporter family permease subunit [Hyphomicrobiales bacterium]
MDALTAARPDLLRARAASRWLVPGLVALVIVLFLLSLGVGPVLLSLRAVVDGLLGTGDEASRLIVREIRLPRAILAVAIGFSLGLSGAALQGLLRNPLASPSLFGAPSAAAFGAVLVIAFGVF